MSNVNVEVQKGINEYIRNNICNIDLSIDKERTALARDLGKVMAHRKNLDALTYRRISQIENLDKLYFLMMEQVIESIGVETDFVDIHGTRYKELLKVETHPLNVIFQPPTIAMNVTIPIGKFIVRIGYEERGDIIYFVKNVGKTGRGKYIHPHISNESGICWGDGSAMACKFIQEGNLVGVLDLILITLCNYNPDNPYQHALYGWGRYMPKDERLCANCYHPVYDNSKFASFLSVCACRRCKCGEVVGGACRCLEDERDGIMWDNERGELVPRVVKEEPVVVDGAARVDEAIAQPTGAPVEQPSTAVNPTFRVVYGETIDPETFEIRSVVPNIPIPVPVIENNEDDFEEDEDA